MGEYDPKLNETGKLLTPRLHWLNMEGYLRSYLYKPAHYMLSVARARQAVEAHCGPEEPQEVKHRRSYGGQRETTRKEVTGNARDGQTNTKKVTIDISVIITAKREPKNLDIGYFFTNQLFVQCKEDDLEILNHLFMSYCPFRLSGLRCLLSVPQIQQLIDLVLTCKRNAENEVKREEGGEGGLTAPGRKRRLEQETATRALKFLKASQEPGGYDKIPGEEAGRLWFRRWSRSSQGSRFSPHLHMLKCPWVIN